jgi:hypothetical protein
MKETHDDNGATQSRISGVYGYWFYNIGRIGG